jgi:hypothetical protein
MNDQMRKREGDKLGIWILWYTKNINVIQYLF